MQEINNKTRLVPKLRFKEFGEEWIETELEKLVDKITVGIATEVRPFVSDKADIPLLRNQNIKAGFFDDSNMEYIIPRFDEANKTKRVQSGDVIIVRTGSNMGNACIVPERFTGAQTFTTLIVRPTFNALNSEFLSYHINYFGLSEILRLSAGGGKPNLNAGFLKRYRINIGAITEQQKIATFLYAVDEKIRQLTRTKELLEQYKKGVMQQIFSGKLRFRGDDGKSFPEWEEKRLGDVGSFKGGGTPTKSESNWSGNIPWVSSSDIFENDIHKIQVTRFINKDALKNSATHLIPKGSVLFVSRVGVGKLAINETDICTSQDFTNFTPTKTNPYFIGYLFSERKSMLINFCQGTSIKGFTKNDLESLIIPFPCLEEQQKIAEFLSGIDTKIERITDQITHTQAFKKGLLQQMFV